MNIDPNDVFDYGKIQENGQYEKYPTNTEGKTMLPIRKWYRHMICGINTMLGQNIAETFAKHPKYYSYTYCVECKGHYPVGEFCWWEGDTPTIVVGSDEYRFAEEDE